MSSSTISDRVAAGHLHRIHRGVYAVGHRNLSNQGRWMAAVLACGTGAVLSHLSAGELWGILRRPRRLTGAGEDGEVRPVHVTVPSTAGKRTPRGLRLHRSATLTAGDRTRWNGIPVTNPARTLADLRRVVSSTELARAVREAEFLRLPIGNEASGGGLREPDRARTRLETRMLALCRRHRLPQPEVNASVDRYEVDFLWPGERLIVEVDGWESHGTRSAFEEDRTRDARLALLGYQVLRFTWRQVTTDRRHVAGTIRGLLQLRT